MHECAATDDQSIRVPASVMVIKDQRTVRSSLVGVLEHQGLAVVETDNLGEAWRKLQDGFLPDVIVLDLELPFPLLSAFYIHRRLHRHQLFSRIPIVVVAAHDTGLSGIPGVGAILHKPLTSQDLFDALRTCAAPGR